MKERIVKVMICDITQVLVTHGGLECGQGLSTKVKQARS